MQHTLAIHVSSETLDQMTRAAEALHCDVADVVERTGFSFKPARPSKTITREVLADLVKQDLPAEEIATRLKISQSYVHACITKLFPETPSWGVLRASFGLYGRAKNRMAATQA